MLATSRTVERDLPEITMERDDVFVSYAHADDQVPHGAKQGWVSTMVEELSKMLFRLRGGDAPRIYIDHQLATGENVDDTLLTRVRTCKSLLLVMSPAYQRSNWCQREVGNFVGVHQGRSPLNVFVVETGPVDRGGWHPALRASKSARFWKSEPRHSVPRLHGYPNPSPDENSLYWVTLNELAHVIAEGLSERQSALESRPVVWLAEPTDDLDHVRDRVAATLRQHGFEPAPSAHYPRDGRAPYEHALQADLDRATLLVQFLGAQAGRKPVWSSSSFVALQALAARSASARRGVPLMQWRPNGFDLRNVVDAEHQELLRGVETSSVEEFKHRVLHTLHILQTQHDNRSPSVADPRPAEKLTTPHIVVNANEVDRELAVRVLDSLVEIGASAALSPQPQPTQTPQQVRLAQAEQLSNCDGVVLIYGDTEPTWVQSQFAITRKVLGQRRKGIWGALLNGPPDDKPDVGLKSPNLVMLDCRGGLDRRLLQTFVSALEA